MRRTGLGENMFGYDLWTLVLGLGAGLACGFLNTAASSGSAVSLPILMLIGLDPISANATNRVPVLIGGISATLSFHAKKALPWSLAFKVSIPATLGSIAGAGLAELLPSRDLGLLITAAVLIALVLLFSKLKQAIEQAGTDTHRYGWREVVLFFGIGLWLGFIVLDGATYMLLALTLAVGLSLTPANAIKSAVLVPTTLVAMVLFAYKGSVDWTVGAIMGVGSVAGAWLGARLATSPGAKKYVFYLLVVVITAELANLGWHFFFHTHG
jgi:uncharacterized membrane protein YfcA